MADLAFTSSKVAAIKPNESTILTGIAAASISAGQAVYRDSNGKWALTDADAAASAVCKGIALDTVGAGQALDILQKGPIAGFTLTQAYDLPIYVSTTAGDLQDAAPTTGDFIFCVGRVGAMSDKDLTKVLMIDISESQLAVAA